VVVHRIFVLSPASCAGKRCRLLLEPGAPFELARRLRATGAPLGEVFSFLSALYFRGKLAYAERFAAPPPGCAGVLVIAPGRGLVDPATRVRASDLRAFGRVPVDARNAGHTEPLRRGALALLPRLPAAAEVVLLGSIASPKYVDVLLDAFGPALRFPAAFVGRGDMSRGGLLLRAVRAGAELDYEAVGGATRRGPRPARLPRIATPRRAGASRPG
jgi:hypothetical protein